MRILRLLIPALLFAPAALGAGVPAGTVISNQARLSAILGGMPVDLASNLATFTVDETIDLTLSWQDSSNVPAQPAETGSILTFRLANTGNGSESFFLSTDGAVAGDQFDPQNPVIFLDGNGNGSYDPGTDLPYDAATNRPTLAADQEATLFIVSDMPASVADGETAICRLSASAVTGSGSPGTVFPPAVPGATSALLGASGGAAAADGTYLISSSRVVLIKSARIADPDGGSEPVTGATVTYSILVTASGSGPATGVVVADPIPPHTTYVPDSLRLADQTSSRTLTDTVDGDAGAIVENPVGSGNYEIRVTLGDLSDTTRTVTFQVTID